jgi:hypothetical protein
VILLHDYFPGNQPLWAGQKPLIGPWAAMERIRRENEGLLVLPLGELPWPTKLGSQVTSLAIVTRK